MLVAAAAGAIVAVTLGYSLLSPTSGATILGTFASGSAAGQAASPLSHQMLESLNSIKIYEHRSTQFEIAARRQARRARAARVSRSSAKNSPGRSSKSGSHTLTCTGGAGPLPMNYATIVSFLVAHGYTGLAAAGIAGNIYQESKGNPESVGTGGGGLIGWTPLPAGFVTGNPSADLRTQLNALLTYNRQWAQYIPVLNSAGSAAQAAYVYMTYFERPGIPATSNRESAAIAVAAACNL